jgi:hypothetical protein
MTKAILLEIAKVDLQRVVAGYRASKVIGNSVLKLSPAPYIRFRYDESSPERDLTGSLLDIEVEPGPLK